MTKEDAISRAEALKIVDELNDGSSECANIRAEIEKLPSVQPKVKTGHWIFDDECREHGHCSKCGYGSVDLVDGEPHIFCRNCGANMEEK